MNMAGSRHILRLFVFPALFVVITACNTDDDILYAPEPILEINDFIWTNMDAYYFWTDLMPRNLNRQTEPDPKAYFDKLLYKPDDKWSFITNNAQALKNSLKGIESTFGHQYGLFQLTGSDQVFGIVQYVIADSPAARAGIKRGDLFYKINGIPLNTGNYASLLFGQTAYSLGFGRIDGEEIIDNNSSISLIAEEVQEYPVHYANTYQVEGHTVGYLMYNQFLSEFEDHLDSVFQTFNNEQITDLVLDLRYNPGGAASTAAYLASLVVPASAISSDQVFNTYLYNDLLTRYFLEEEGPESPRLIRKFADVPYNLDLQRIYILVSSSTASASELVINGLRPYMDVILIGPESTSGKYTGSITIEDREADHGWALQPIISKVANALGATDYGEGFPPDFIVVDDLTAPLGSLEEDMLAQAVALITGMQGPARISTSTVHESIVSAGMHPVQQRQRLWLDEDALD
jgi:C-terminal processing protease CtpA/Prc